MKKGIISALSAFTGAALGASIVKKSTNKKYESVKANSQKYAALFKMMNQWVKVKQDGKNLSSYFLEHNYKNIAVYGMGLAGETLLNELKDTEIIVIYGIDKRADVLYSGIDILTIEDSLDKVDAVVVTAITFFDEIQEQLSEKIDCPIISLEDILYEI